jgi:hypothetical protein
MVKCDLYSLTYPYMWSVKSATFLTSLRKSLSLKQQELLDFYLFDWLWGTRTCWGKFFHVFLSGIGGGVQLGPLGTAATKKHSVPAPGDFDDGEICGMRIGRGNRSTRRKPAPVPLCPPLTSHAARVSAVGSQRLTAWATARPPAGVSGKLALISCSRKPMVVFPNNSWV